MAAGQELRPTKTKQKDHPFTQFFKPVACKKGRVAAIKAAVGKPAVITDHMFTKEKAYEQVKSEEAMLRIKKD